MMNCKGTAHGYTIIIMAMSGCLVSNEVSYHMLPVVIGSRQSMATRGYRIIHGAGRHFIMVAGFMMISTDGCGHLTMCGGLRGWRGEAAADIMAGLR